MEEYNSDFKFYNTVITVYVFKFSLFAFLYSNEKYDVVFLQEIWYEKDYDFVANCTKANYHISNYDWKACGAANEVSKKKKIRFEYSLQFALFLTHG